MAPRVSSPTFVGRAQQQGQVLAALQRAGDGLSAVLLVAGEAGVGKTRFVHEAAARSGSVGVRVLEGNCLRLGTEGVPFGAVVQALRGLRDDLSPDQMDKLLGASRRELSRLMPRLRHEGDRPASTPDEGASQGSLFEHFWLFVDRLTRLSPVLLIVEDVHWADRSTLDLLVFLARNLPPRFLLLATYRSDEVNRRHPLVPVLAELERAGEAIQLRLDRFNRRELHEQVAGILHEPPEVSLVDELWKRSGGNPFLAEELLAARDLAGRLPSTLREVLFERFAGLSPSTQELVRVASAGGNVIRPAVLARVMSTDETTLDRGLREAIESQLLVLDEASAGERLTFAHALVQEAVYADLLAGERSRLHAAFAQALLREPGVESDAWRTAELAFHWYEAGDLLRAFDASVEAGLAAERLYAVTDALQNFERALALLEEMPELAGRTSLDVVDLLVHAATVALDAATDRSVRYLERAISLVDSASDPWRAGLLHASLSVALWRLLDDEHATQAIAKAVALVPEEPATVELARVLCWQGMLLAHSFDRHRESAGLCERALAVARAAGAPRVESTALQILGIDTAALGDLEGGLAHLAEARRLAIEVEMADPALRVMETTVWETAVLFEAGRLEAAASNGLGADAYAQRNGVTARFGTHNASLTADALLALGRWDEADQLLTRAQRYQSHTFGDFVLGVRLGTLDGIRGNLDVALRRLKDLHLLSATLRGPETYVPLVVALAEVSLWEHDPLACRDWVNDGLDRVDSAPDVWIGHPGMLCALGIRAEAETARHPRAGSADRREAQATGAELLDRMRTLQRDVTTRRPLYSPQADAWLATCEGEWSRLVGVFDADQWAIVAAGWDDLHRPYQSAYALMREAEAAFVGQRDRPRVAAALRQAHVLAERLGAAPLQRRVTELASASGVRLLGVVRSPQKLPEAWGHGLGQIREPAAGPLKPMTPRSPNDLTRRELEVLDLVAAGRSDAEIADELFISKKTVAVHVANIKGKLSAVSRVEMVLGAIERGLIAAPPPGSR